GDVLRRQPAAMRLDDLAADGQAEAGILAESLAGRPVGVEALEYAVDRVDADAGAVVVDRDDDMARQARQADDDSPALLRREGARILDEIGEHLPEPQIVPGDVEVALVVFLPLDLDHDLGGFL